MLNILFAKPDAPESVEFLRRAMQNIHTPILGLIVKVNENDEIVNVELTDEQTVKSLALAGAMGDEYP